MKKVELKIILTSTRQERQGIAVANWFAGFVSKNEFFNTEVLDLKEINLPMLDEPKHPRLQEYQFDHTRQWSSKIAHGDAFVFVMPEYNYSMPPAMVNAVDYLFHEWNYKPAALVSYGGISGGLRSAQMSKLLLTTVKMMPLSEGVSIPFFTKHINEAGVFSATEQIERSADVMLKELAKWAEGLRYMRKNIV